MDGAGARGVATGAGRWGVTDRVFGYLLAAFSAFLLTVAVVRTGQALGYWP